ncbi:uncharacterized protein METZ01_LOCUS143616 [marine metagenome]|uniref:Uncharacterized protein n=1 Tax=marine metagenome TaxID=408172 RepID=A0A381ZPG6_9ZZZZ
MVENGERTGSAPLLLGIEKGVHRGQSVCNMIHDRDAEQAPLYPHFNQECINVRSYEKLLILLRIRIIHTVAAVAYRLIATIKRKVFVTICG